MVVTAADVESFHHAFNELGSLGEEADTLFRKLLAKLEEARQANVQLEQDIDNYRVFGDISILEQEPSTKPPVANSQTSFPDEFDQLRIDTQNVAMEPKLHAAPSQPNSALSPTSQSSVVKKIPAKKESIQTSKWASPAPPSNATSTPLSPSAPLGISAARAQQAKLEKVASLKKTLQGMQTETPEVRGARIIGPVLRDRSGRRYDRRSRAGPDQFNYWRERRVCVWNILRSDCKNDRCRMDHSINFQDLEPEDWEAIWAVARIGWCTVFRREGDCTDEYCIYGHRDWKDPEGKELSRSEWIKALSGEFRSTQYQYREASPIDEPEPKPEQIKHLPNTKRPSFTDPDDW